MSITKKSILTRQTLGLPKGVKYTKRAPVCLSCPPDFVVMSEEGPEYGFAQFRLSMNPLPNDINYILYIEITKNSDNTHSYTVKALDKTITNPNQITRLMTDFSVLQKLFTFNVIQSAIEEANKSIYPINILLSIDNPGGAGILDPVSEQFHYDNMSVWNARSEYLGRKDPSTDKFVNSLLDYSRETPSFYTMIEYAIKCLSTSIKEYGTAKSDTSSERVIRFPAIPGSMLFTKNTTNDRDVNDRRHSRSWPTGGKGDCLLQSGVRKLFRIQLRQMPGVFTTTMSQINTEAGRKNVEIGPLLLPNYPSAQKYTVNVDDGKFIKDIGPYRVGGKKHTKKSKKYTRRYKTKKSRKNKSRRNRSKSYH